MASRSSVTRVRGGGGASRSKIGISRVGGSRSRTGVSTGVSGHTGAGVDGVRVFLDGVNVTPQSLLQPYTPPKSEQKPSSEVPTKRPSAEGGGGVPARKKSSLSLDTQVSAAAAAARGEGGSGGGGGGGGGNKSPGRRKREGQTGDRGPREEDLNAPVTVGLSETATVILLEIRGSAVATDLREFGKYQQEKQEYEKTVQERIGSDRYTSRHTQTVNWALKTKEVTAAIAATKDASCAANTWEIFDEQSKGMDQANGDDGVYGGAGSKAETGGEVSAVERQAAELATVTLASVGCLLETESTVAPPPLSQEASADTGGRSGGGGGGGTGLSTNIVNPNASRARGVGGGGGGGTGGAGRKGNNSGASRRGSQSSASVGTTGAAGGGASKMNIDGGGAFEEIESPIDARGAAEVLAAQQAEKIIVSTELLNSLELVERSIFQIFFHSTQLEYRNYPPVEGAPSAAGGLLFGGGGAGIMGNAASSGAVGLSSAGGGNGGLVAATEQQQQNEAWETTSTSTKQEDGASKNASLELLWTHRYPFGGEHGESGTPSNGNATQTNVAGSAATATLSGGARQQVSNRAPRSGGGEVGGVGALAAGEGSINVGVGGRGAAAVASDQPGRRDRTVTALCFHQLNRDVLAVGYGAFFFSPSVLKGGAVLFWSVRNPEYPERTIGTHSSVTSLDFSERHPTLLAVGMYDGTTAIYDTAREGEHFSVAVAESSTSPGKHTDPVWQVKWVNKGVERGETLVSISTDGRVVEWSMKKGLSYSPLMVLKRIGNTEGVISRQASGLSFDFPPGDGATYYAGTEDGLIHKCSVSYSEQYLETYHGHTGPVYRIRCSPFCERLLLSCSADWTVRLWEERQTTPLHTLRSVDLWDVVNDIAWSPTCSTVFASVAGDGRVQLWDLAQSTLDPIVSTDANRPGLDATGNGSVGNPVLLSVDETVATGLSPRPTRDQDGGRSEFGGVSPRSPTTKSQTRGAGGEWGVAGSANALPGVRPRGVQLTAVAFAANAPVLAVGDSRGNVDVYKIVGVDLTPDVTRNEQIDRLRKAVLPPELEG